MRRPAIALLLLAAHSPLFAANSFTPDDQPYGYIAPVALSAHSLSSGSEKLFRPWFDYVTGEGAIKAYGLAGNGTVATSESWSWNNAAGTVIHGTPVYVGAPDKGYAFDSYMAFAHKYASEDGTARTGTLYVGANDGKLYSLNAGNGSERGSYTPSMVSSSAYGVDGPLAAGDAYGDFGTGNEWKTILIGALGAGGRGYFALDITDETNLQSLWSFDTSDSANLGYSYAKPLIVRLNYDTNNDDTCSGSDYRWGALLANGYMNTVDSDADSNPDGDGKARLYVVDITDGSLLKEFELTGSQGSPNGLSAPAAVDSDGDGAAELVYAGDLDGNLWKFDLASCLTSNWSAAKNSGGNIKPLFSATDSSADQHAQAITTAPEVAVHPEGGYLVYVGTGEALVDGGQINSATHDSLYGLWDKNQRDADTGALSAITPLSRSALVSQSIAAISGHSDARTLTSSTVDWESKSGWKIDLDADEKVLQPMLVRDGRVQLMITDTADNKHWLTQVDYEHGTAPDEIVFDAHTADGDAGVLNSDDDLGGKRVAALKMSGDLVSQPVIARASTGDIAYLNQWTDEPETLPTVEAPQCQAIFFEVKSNSAHWTYSIEVTGYLNDSSTISRRVDIDVGTNNSDESDNTYTYTPATPDRSSGAGKGLVDGEETGWDGLGFAYPDKVENNEIELQVKFDSPYKLVKYDLKLIDFNVDLIDDGEVVACDSSDEGGAVDGDYLVEDGALGEDAGSGASWSNSTLSLDNYSGLIFNSDKSALAGSLPQPTGTTDDQLQADTSVLTGRLVWRELQF